jgi:[histone H3]-lysine9 N-dimethyltransferase
LSKEIEEVKPVHLELDILQTPYQTNPIYPVVPEVPPGFDAKQLTVQSVKFKRSLSVPVNATPISVSPVKLGRGRKSKTPVSDEKPESKKPKLAVRGLSRELALLVSSTNSVTQPRAHVGAILSTFNAIRCRLEQISEEDGAKKRQDMSAGKIMSENKLMTNEMKRVGPVPGVEVGDIFYFRMEMRVVGLHSLPMAGIDNMIDDGNLIAIAIVASEGYKNEVDKADEMVYIGQGGNGRDLEKKGDQKLEGGNYAMKQSFLDKKPIRVIRSIKDPFMPANSIYIYDGLYKIIEWQEDYEEGFKIFKNKLVRETGQPDGFAIWKMMEQWKKEPFSRGLVLTFDLSSGVESIPVVVVNEVDNDPQPDNFTYATGMVPEQTMTEKGMVLEGCKCNEVCVIRPGRKVRDGAVADKDICYQDGCYCMINNGGLLPYSSSGLLVKRLPMLYECGLCCECKPHCRNRVTQRGVKLHFEVFRTENRGWGLRSWDPIRAGSFVCEFVGESLETTDVDSEYVFCATDPGEKVSNWNRGMELAENGGDGKCYESELVPIPVQMPVMKNAKELGNVSRFINHSCDPNLLWQLVLHGHGDAQSIHIMFFAVKHIPPMTELTYDYNGNAKERRGREAGAKKCLCSSVNCRGEF